MNAARRKVLKGAVTHLATALGAIEEARGILEDVISEEQEYYDNMPESLQSGEKGETAQNLISALEELKDALDSAQEAFETGQSVIEEA